MTRMRGLRPARPRGTTRPRDVSRPLPRVGALDAFPPPPFALAQSSFGDALARDGARPMERIPSADDFMASLWRTQNAHAALHPGGVARTPSQNEMETYFNAMLAGQTPQNVNALEALTPREGTPTPGGIPRVASIDFLRKMIIGQQ